MRKGLCILLLPALLCVAPVLSAPVVRADDSLKNFLRNAREELSAFRDEALAGRDAFRDSVLNELSQWLSQPWEPKPMEPAVPPPLDDPPVPPVVIPPDEPEPVPETEPVLENPVVAPAPQPAPAPPQPVLPPAPLAPQPEWFAFTSYGTAYRVDAAPAIRRAMPAAREALPARAAARAFEAIDSEQLDRLASSLSDEARRHNLGDWAFLKLTEHFTAAFLPGDNANARKMLQGILLLAAGYDVRFGEAPALGRLYLLVGCRELILNANYYKLDGAGCFYPMEATPDNGLRITGNKFEGTRLLTVQPSGKERFDNRPGKPHEVKVCLHVPHCRDNMCTAPADVYALTGNLNRMAYLTDCPRYVTAGNDYSQWNTYAQTRLSDEYERQLYPSLRRALAGKSKLDAANYLMKFVEAFDYKLDSEMWGVADRAFFPDETLHYPFRDCEDGAILFTRLVRDLLGLPVALVYYPGHMAAAVAFDTPVSGAYINSNGRRYTICDPTYYYVDAGVQMPPDVVDASQAVLIPLR